MIIAPIVVVGISLGIYYAVNKEKFTSCTCAKDNEKYTYAHNQPKKDLHIELQPVNSFGPSTITQSEPKERYSTAYYKEPQNNPETNERFSGV
jgi:hypothetical protein